jgi:sulfate adenylyltransferase subunit 2
LWNLLNGQLAPGENMRIFPLSNCTELDVWNYIRAEDIPIVPLYFTAERLVVRRGRALIMIDDDRLRVTTDEKPSNKTVRLRSLGCHPFAAAIRSEATTLDAIIAELHASCWAGRLIDMDESSTMEREKREGYF